MKKALIGAIVGAILIFAWQAISNMFLHYHDVQYRTVANQDAVIANLSAAFKEEGQYMVPMHDMNASNEEKDKWMKEMEGKPWAQVIYHTAWHGDMVTPMIRSFSTAFLCVLILIGIMGRNPGGFGNIFMKSLGAGFLAFMFVWYNQHVWMHIPWPVVQAQMIDFLVAWGLCGLWLGMYLRKR